jgi:hypothetical protein
MNKQKGQRSNSTKRHSFVERVSSQLEKRIDKLKILQNDTNFDRISQPEMLHNTQKLTNLNRDTPQKSLLNTEPSLGISSGKEFILHRRNRTSLNGDLRLIN